MQIGRLQIIIQGLITYKLVLRENFTEMSPPYSWQIRNVVQLVKKCRSLRESFFWVADGNSNLLFATPKEVPT